MSDARRQQSMRGECWLVYYRTGRSIWSSLAISVTAIAAAVSVSADQCNDFCHADRFCGNDGNCHRFNCDEWFRYGPREYTGIESIDDVRPLSCEPWFDQDATRRAAVQYGCNFYHNEPIRPDKAVAMDFNERCSSRIDADTVFECLRVDRSTFFVDFLNVIETANVNCTRSDVHRTAVYYYPAIFSNELEGSAIDGLAMIKTRTFDLDLTLNYSFRSTVRYEPVVNDTELELLPESFMNESQTQAEEQDPSSMPAGDERIQARLDNVFRHRPAPATNVRRKKRPVHDEQPPSTNEAQLDGFDGLRNDTLQNGNGYHNLIVPRRNSSGLVHSKTLTISLLSLSIGTVVWIIARTA